MKDIFDINKPVFLIKINIDNLTDKNVQDVLHSYKEYFKYSKSANYWLMTVRNELSDIKCIWSGVGINGTADIDKLNNIISGLDSNHVDIITNGITLTDELREQINFNIRMFKLKYIIE